MFEFIPMFPEILAASKLELEIKERRRISKYIRDNQHKFKKRKKDNVLFEESPIKLHQLEEMKPLMTKVAKAVSIAIKKYGVNPDYLKLHITRSWANLNPETTVTASHTHLNSHLSIVYYPDNSCSQATINFLNSNSAWIPGISHPSYVSSGNFTPTEASAQTLCYTPAEDLCLIFPSNIAHSVSPNPSKKPRISIAMDTLFTLKSYIRDEPLLPPPSDWQDYPL